MLDRAAVAIDIKDPHRPVFLKAARRTKKPKVAIIAIVNSEKEILNFEIGFRRHNPYRGSFRPGFYLDKRSHKPVELSEELKQCLRWFIGELADERVRQSSKFVMNLRDCSSARLWTNRTTKSVEVFERRGWIVPRFMSLTVDPKDSELYSFFLSEEYFRKMIPSLDWFAKTVNYHTRRCKTTRNKGFRQVLKILRFRREFLGAEALRGILPHLARKELFLQLLETKKIVSEDVITEVRASHMKNGDGKHFHLRLKKNGLKRTGCASFKVYGENNLPHIDFEVREVN